SILIYGDTVCEDNKKSLESALNCWLDSDVLYECDEINIKLRKNNYCCSFSYSGIINRDLKETYIVPTYKFINDNYTNDCFIDFNGVVEEKEFLSNFPMGRSFDSFSNKTILDAAWSKKDTLQEDESLNYYIRYITNQVGYGVKYLNIQEITEKIGHSLIDHGEYIEIKDYDNKLFRIYKVDNTKVDFDTIEAV
ncbi:MAG: hypothetical protein IJ086_00765, partial [Clostridium sp.]|nr:hypothetical protein [Clostridium sp.]